METFVDWLQNELRIRAWGLTEMEHAGGPKITTLSRILTGERGVGEASARKIARALAYSEDLVMRQAGLMSPIHDEDHSASLKRLHEIGRKLTEEEREEMIYIALGKLERRGAKATS